MGKIDRQTNGKLDERKPYRKPVLTQYDDLRTLTLGSSPIGSESGPGGENFRVVPDGSSPVNTWTGENSSSDNFDR